MKHILQLPDHYKVWIFTANRFMKDEEAQILYSSLQTLLKQWESHGIPLQSHFAIIENAILLVTADAHSQHIGGCSQDKLMAFVKTASEPLHLDFFDRYNFLVKHHHQSFMINLKTVQHVNPEWLIANPYIENLEQYKRSFFVPPGNHPAFRHFIQKPHSSIP